MKENVEGKRPVTGRYPNFTAQAILYSLPLCTTEEFNLGYETSLFKTKKKLKKRVFKLTPLRQILLQQVVSFYREKKGKVELKNTMQMV